MVALPTGIVCWCTADPEYSREREVALQLAKPEAGPSEMPEGGHVELMAASRETEQFL